MTMIKCGLCGKVINVYGECDCKEEEVQMNEVKVSTVQALKDELAERYGLNVNQIEVDVRIFTPDRTLANEILTDNNDADRFGEYQFYNQDLSKCANSYGKEMDMWVHFKDVGEE